MASTSGSSSQGQVGKYRKCYDVFLSFRGEDTRKNFTDHLHFSLTQKGIFTFLDDKRLEKGGAIKPELLRAIENSKFAIVVLSKNYASSTWCLDELAKIIDCMNTMGLRVFPVFYDVDPSDVRKQKGNFEIAFQNHEKDFGHDSEKVQKWRTAMTTAADLCGWDVRDSHQHKTIQEITRDVFDKLNLNHTFSSTIKEVFGINSHMVKLSTYLDAPSDDAVLIGIHGMGGIGKTTLARFVYDRISTQFEASSFMADIREFSKSHGIVPLQEQLLSQLLMEQSVQIRDKFQGIGMIRSRLHEKKVLIVLDDVDKSDQLRFLAGKPEWFGSGSRVIITARDEHLLSSHGVDNLYKMKELNWEDALQLFSLKAFRGVSPPTEVFLNLCNKFVTYAGGLPLALEVLGSFLCGRDLDEWTSTLERLQKESENEILDRLEVSYEGLKDEEKQIFLDIACFFKGMDRDYAKKVLDSCGFSTAIGIRVLIDKSLISIVDERILWMHDLLQEMGRSIVRKESPKQPGRRSRLWRNEDIFRVLTKNTATDAVEVIKSTPFIEKEVNVIPEAFVSMDQLRLLKICNVQHLPQGLHFLSNELRHLEWHGYPLSCLPSSFRPNNLFAIDLRGSRIERLWNETTILDKLTYINLSYSKSLRRIPDLTGLPNLEKLLLVGCTNLVEVPSSLWLLKQLLILDMKDCKSLSKLPDIIKMKSLQVFNVSGWSNLKKFPEVEGEMESLSELFLDGTAIEQLPESIHNLTGLVLLNLTNCKKLHILPDSICGLKSLKFLKLSGCENFAKLPENLADLECLEELDLGETALTQPPSSIGLLKNLKKLSFDGCGQPCGPSSTSLLKFFFPRRGLDSVCLSLPNRLGLSSLTELNLSNCNLLEGMSPMEIGCFSSLYELNLSFSNVVSIPVSISQLPKLEKVFWVSCRRLQSLPEFPSLPVLAAENCTSLEKFPNPLRHCTSDRKVVYLHNCLRLIGNHDGASLAETWLKTYLQRYGRRSNWVWLCLPGSGIPKWFSHQSMGSSVRMDIPLCPRDSTLWGLAVSVNFRLRHSRVPVSASDDYYHGYLHWEPKPAFEIVLTNEQGSDLRGRVVLTGLIGSRVEVGSEHLVIQYGSGSFLKGNIEKEQSIIVSFVNEKNSPWDVEISKCGAQLVYDQDPKNLEDLENPDVQVSEAEEIGVKRTNDEESCDKAGPSAEEEPPTQKIETALNNSLAC